jgi:hypothetical protein
MSVDAPPSSANSVGSMKHGRAVRVGLSDFHILTLSRGASNDNPTFLAKRA